MEPSRIAEGGSRVDDSKQDSSGILPPRLPLTPNHVQRVILEGNGPEGDLRPPSGCLTVEGHFQFFGKNGTDVVSP